MSRATHSYIQIASFALLGILVVACAPFLQKDATLIDIHETLKSRKFVDLTHAFEPGIPHHPLLPNEEREAIFTVEEHGFFVEQFNHVGQWGTHVDPPGHFVAGGRLLDALTPKEMILPLVVIDVHEKAQKNHDYTITMKDIGDWESRHGEIPSGSFVAMRTDWSKRWPDGDAMQNRDNEGTKHYPGWNKEVLEFLVNKRNVTAIGHETTDTDPGLATTNDDYSLEYYILEQDKYQIELMANLDQVPEWGSLIFVSWPKPKDGSGFPARAIAIIP